MPYIGAQLILAGGAENYAAGVAGETFADLKSEAYLTATPDNLLGELYLKKVGLDETLDIANAHLRAPLFSKEWLGRIGDGINANIKEAFASPNFLSYQTSRWALLGDSPLRRSLALDVPNIIGAVTFEDLKDWKQQTITSAALISIAGTLTPAEAGAAIDKLMNNLPANAAEKVRNISINFAPRTILLHTPDIQTSSITFVAPIPPTKNGKELEDIIIAQALGGDDQSALFKAVRTDLRAAYAFGAGIDAYSRENRVVVMSGEVETGKITEVRDAVSAAYTKFKNDGPEGEIEPRKAGLRASITEGKNNVSRTSFSALMALLDGQDAATSLTIETLLNEVSNESVKARLKDGYRDVDKFVVIATSPDANALPGACVIKLPQEAVSCK